MATHDTTIVAGRSDDRSEGERDDGPARGRGTRVGRYLVLGELGRGGMGVVYRAYDPELDRPLAIKCLAHASVPGSASRLRLRREAQTLARLDDPHVVTIYDVGEDEAGLFIAMELVAGEDLAAWLQRGSPPWSETLARFVAAGRGLAAAHRVGVVHRDFKPANVLLGDDGRVAVTDFGLARPDAEATGDPPSSGEASSPPSSAEITALGARIGTPAYMAPEQHEGRAADARADQYAFCVALYEGLFGERPFRGETLAELARAKQDGLARWPEGSKRAGAVPSRVRAAITRGLSPDPARRFASMEALLDRLDPAPRRRRGIAIAAVLGLTVVGVFGVSRSDAATDPCAGSQAALGPAWDDEAREAVRSGLLKVDRSYAEAAAASAVAELDAWAQRWTETHREVCEATWRRGEQSAAALDHRMGCLDERRHALEATTAALAEGTPEAVERWRDLVIGLPEPGRCRDLPPPSEARDRGEGSSRVTRRLAELDALRRAGRGREALEASEQLAQEVGPGLAPRPGASLYTLLGILRDDSGDFGGAREALERAARLARRSDDPRAEAEVWIELTRVVGTHLHDAAHGQQLGDLALAAVAAAGGDPELRAHALLELGEVAFRSGDDDRTLAYWTEAEALRREQFGDHDVRVAQVHARLAGVDLRRGDPQAARARLEEVIERYGQAFGPGHPRMAAPLGNLGFVLSALGEHDTALAHMQRAVEIAVHSRGPLHPQVAGGHDAIGNVLAAAGRHAEAVPEFEAAIEGFERSLGPEHPALATPLLGLGQAQLALGRPALAVAPLERALSLATAADLPPVETADTRFALARALAATDRPRAQQLVGEALAVYEAALPPDDPRRTDALTWQREHAAPPP